MASDYLQGASLQFVGLHYETSLYELHGPQFTNRYYILSGAGTRQLMAFPEVVGFDSYQAMLPATVAALRLLFPGSGGDVDILTILRGGLNYPVEEACARNGIRVRDIHFVSCERIIENHIITGLDIKYEKIRVSKDRVLVIGDIIATGDTLRLCLSQVVDRFRRRGGSIRKIIFFTIGGTRAIGLMEKMADDIRAVFPEFEGFECFFYEGIFTVYENPGASGINVPDIDFDAVDRKLEAFAKEGADFVLNALAYLETHDHKPLLTEEELAERSKALFDRQEAVRIAEEERIRAIEEEKARIEAEKQAAFEAEERKLKTKIRHVLGCIRRAMIRFLESL